MEEGWQASGDPAGARAAIDEAAQAMPAQEIVALHNPAPAERARLLLAQGDVREAGHWAEARGLAETDDFSYPREREYLVLARVLLAQNAPDRALVLLERLRTAAEAQGRAESAIEAGALMALALAACGEQAQAQAALVEALALARPEGYVRVFADEGAPMKLLIADCGLQLARRPDAESDPHADNLLAYIDKVLAAFSGSGAQAGIEPATNDQSPICNQQSAMVEPLTERELEVLRALAAGLANRAIAQQFSLSLATVKVHLKHIYGKLAVHSRTQALARARELNVL
jgi:LuxR family maltose regulon positive regulatory protein